MPLIIRFGVAMARAAITWIHSRGRLRAQAAAQAPAATAQEAVATGSNTRACGGENS
jgi:hypothetical protein